MKKIFTTVIICLMITSIAFATAGPITTAGSTLVCDQSPFSIPVTVSNFTNVGIISLTLNFGSPNIVFQSVDLNPALLSGNIFTNGNTPGMFILSFTTGTGISLADNSLLFTLHLVHSGPPIDQTFFITWPETPAEANEYATPAGIVFDKSPFGNYFINGNIFIEPGCGPNGPVTTAGSVSVCLKKNFTVPVTITSFNGVGYISLLLNYDAALMQYQGVSVNPVLESGSLLYNGNDPGKFILSYINDAGISLQDHDTLFAIDFVYTGPPTPVTTPVTWLMIPEEANEYATLDGVEYNKVPFGQYFINGSITFDPEGCGVLLPLPNWPLYLAFLLMLSATVYFFRRRMM
jgi:hypothetical protein